jgi:hypothetical protein
LQRGMVPFAKTLNLRLGKNPPRENVALKYSGWRFDSDLATISNWQLTLPAVLVGSETGELYCS